MTSRIKKVCLYGGSFNPPTNGHIDVAEYVLTTLSIDKIIFVPCNNHPWSKKLISFQHRMKMCKLSIKENMGVSDIEYRYDLPGSTYALVRKYKELHPSKNLELFFIVGMDEANNFMKWKRYRDLSKLATFIVVPRPGIRISSFTKTFFGGSHIILPPCTHMPKISSTEIRKHLSAYYASKTKLSIKMDTDSKVLSYILKNKLYQ